MINMSKSNIKRGPKPRPLALVETLGNPGKRTLPPEDACKLALGRAPEGLEADAAEAWNRIAGFAHWLTRADRDAVEMYVNAWLICRRADAAILRMLAGASGESPQGTLAGMSGPSMQADPRAAQIARMVRKQAAETIHRLMPELGFTPAARTVAGFIPADPADSASDEDEFFGDAESA